jgi:hypothetical protein
MDSRSLQVMGTIFMLMSVVGVFAFVLQYGWAIGMIAFLTVFSAGFGVFLAALAGAVAAIEKEAAHG